MVCGHIKQSWFKYVKIGYTGIQDEVERVTQSAAAGGGPVAGGVLASLREAGDGSRACVVAPQVCFVG